MTLWVAAAAIYGLVLTFAALTQPVRHRHVTVVATLAYSLTAVGAGSVTESFWVVLFVPGGLMLTGYWLGGLLFGTPQPWLEAWLLRIDGRLQADRWLAALPRSAVELLEISYASAYVIIGGGAIFAATFGVEPLTQYWNIGLTSTLAAYAPLPWLRSRPPRVLEQGIGAAGRAPGPTLRRLNVAILDAASVQANTLPSGHVSGAVAAALALMPMNAAVGWTLLAVSILIALAAVAGRYHYVIDCVTGAALAVVIFLLTR